MDVTSAALSGAADVNFARIPSGGVNISSGDGQISPGLYCGGAGMPGSHSRHLFLEPSLEKL